MSELTIDSVRQDFKVWRTSRTKKGKIPEHLWDKVFKLLEQHPIGQVVQSLHLSGGQVSAKCKQRATDLNGLSTTRSVNFVALDMPPTLSCNASVDNSFSKLEIRRSDGAVLAIERLAEQTLLQVLNKFTQGL